MSIKLLKTKHIYKGRLLHLTLDTLLVGKEHIFRETIHHPGSCAIMPLTDDGKIVLVRQYRYSAKTELLEIPAGAIEPEETPYQCAIRELKEEVGIKAKSLKKILDFYPCPGYSSERIHLFVGRKLQRVEKSPESDELINTQTMRIKDAIRLVKTGRIKDAKTIIGLLFLKERFSG